MTSLFIYLKAPPAAARETLPIVATKREYRPMRNGPCTPITRPPKMSKSWLIRGAAQYLGKLKETVGEKRGPMNSVNYLTSLAALKNQFREEKVYLHLKLYLAKSYKQEYSSNYRHTVMET